MTTQDWSAKENHFPALRKLVAQEGLFERRPVKSILAMILNITAFFVGIFAITQRQEWWFLVIIGLYMGVVCSQFGYLMHDAGHNQIFKKQWKNLAFGYLAILFNGSSLQAWIQDHNEHHQHPNHEDADPDIDIYFLLYSEKQVDNAPAVMKYLSRFQAWFAIPIYTLVAHFMRYGAVFRKMKHLKDKRLVPLDLAMIAFWHVAYYGGLYMILGFWKTVLFVMVHQSMTGFILGMAFAPNHKGMPLFEKEDNLNWFTKQVYTARNIHANVVTDFLYGGLNFQIEHHLFPTMPRLHLPKAHKITKAFCKEHDVDYHETGIIESYSEVLGALNEVSAYSSSLHMSVEDVQMHLAISLENLKRDMKEKWKNAEFSVPSKYLELRKNMIDRMAEIEKSFSQSAQMNRSKLHAFRKEIREMKKMIKQMRLDIG